MKKIIILLVAVVAINFVMVNKQGKSDSNLLNILEISNANAEQTGCFECDDILTGEQSCVCEPWEAEPYEYEASYYCACWPDEYGGYDADFSCSANWLVRCNGATVVLTDDCGQIPAI